MSKFDEFVKKVNTQINMKCSYYKLNPKIIKFMLLGNLVLIEIPSFHTFTNYVYFKGSKKNELYILLDINHYLEEGLESIFTSSIKITDDDYIQMIDNYDGEE